jgi:hypothetical protein
LRDVSDSLSGGRSTGIKSDDDKISDAILAQLSQIGESSGSNANDAAGNGGGGRVDGGNDITVLNVNMSGSNRSSSAGKSGLIEKKKLIAGKLWRGSISNDDNVSEEYI